MLVRIKELLEKILFKKKIESSMGLQFMVPLAGIIAGLMALGAFFIGRILIEGQYRELENRGRELGTFLGKAAMDPLLRKEFLVLDGLVGEATKSKDLLYVYVSDDTNRVVDDVQASFSRSDKQIQALLAADPAASVEVLSAKARAGMDILEIQVPIIIGTSRIGAVTLGFSRAGAKRESRRIIWLLVGTSILIVIVLSGTVYRLAHSRIVLPTREAVQVASNIAAGDLTHVVRVRSVDELGMLGRGLNRMIVGLKGMIGSIRQAARNTETVWGEVRTTSEAITSGSQVQSESVEEAASSVNEMHYALKEIAGNVEDVHASSEKTSASVIELAASVGEVAHTMTDLSGSIEETTTAIAEMTAGIREIAENVETLSSVAEQTSASSSQISASVREVESAARQSASLAQGVATDAQELGMRAIEKMIGGMGRIEANAKRTAEVVNRLGERAESIGSILTVIEDITDQTSLLALNAAILAAQAGEHGKGFAVVATEIRQLANRTAASTQEIGKLIASVQDETRQAVETMHEGGAIVKDGVQLANDAGEALGKIVSRAASSSDMSRSINRAAEEQARGVKQVSDAVQQINKMAHQFAAAAQQQKTGTDQIMRAAEKMREITRFVTNSTAEQAKAGKDITSAVEDMRSRIGMVKRATEELQAGSDLIVKAIERIKQIARSNVDQAAGLNGAMDVISKQAGTLNKEIEKFKL